MHSNDDLKYISKHKCVSNQFNNSDRGQEKLYLSPKANKCPAFSINESLIINHFLMYLSLADQYYLQALDHYPYCLTDAIAALGYALSYDENHPQAHCLMGRLMMEKVKDYDVAAHHFEISLLNGPGFVDTYKYYSMLQIWLGKYDKAEAIIRRGLKVPGMETAALKYNRAILHETRGNLERALKEISHVIQITSNPAAQVYLEAELERMKRKSVALNKPKERVLMHER
jgi:tetratricopeptide (TPR) repeat protein